MAVCSALKLVLVEVPLLSHLFAHDLPGFAIDCKLSHELQVQKLRPEVATFFLIFLVVFHLLGRL